MGADKNILKVFGYNLRKHRHQKGLSLRALYNISGIDNGTLCRMENGKVNVTLKTMSSLADALDVPYWKLITPDPAEMAVQPTTIEEPPNV